MGNPFQSGFVNIFGAPNAGKSTLLNALLGEDLVITSDKVQTTRHRILGILTEPAYQIVFSDTPGIISPQYRLHERMMRHVKSALEDADVALIVHDCVLPPQDLQDITESLRLKAPTILLINKIDRLPGVDRLKATLDTFTALFPSFDIIPISASQKRNIDKIIPAVLKHLPEGPLYYPDDHVSDRPVRFFAAELIREQIFKLFHEEIPYHTAVIVQAFEEKDTLTVIRADIIVSRETQKVILIGKGGSMIKQIGTQARQKIEAFIERRVHLELFVKVRPKWRDNDLYLSEYGYS